MNRGLFAPPIQPHPTGIPPLLSKGFLRDRGMPNCHPLARCQLLWILSYNRQRKFNLQTPPALAVPQPNLCNKKGVWVDWHHRCYSQETGTHYEYQFYDPSLLPTHSSVTSRNENHFFHL